MELGGVFATIALVSFLSYFTSYARRVLAREHDERFIVLLEVLLVFVFTTSIMFAMTGRKDMMKAVEKFKLKDLKLITASALALSVLSILWIHVINFDELSRIQFIRRGLDLTFALGGGYLLLKEGITLRKGGAFILLLAAAYLLSY
jgi:drug/metabolite transporter (DMT)-like permease